MNSGLVYHEFLIGIPLTHEFLIGIPQCHEFMVGIPWTHEFTTGIPLTHEFTTGMPLTQEFMTGVPLTHEFRTGIPLTQEFTTGIPLTQEFRTGMPLTQEFTTGVPLPRSSVLACHSPRSLRLAYHYPGVQDWHATHPGVLGWLCPAPGRPWQGSSCFLWLQSLLCRSRACSFRTLERNKNFWLWADFSLASTSSKNQHLNTVIEFMNGSCLPKRCFVQQFSESVLLTKASKGLVTCTRSLQHDCSADRRDRDQYNIYKEYVQNNVLLILCWIMNTNMSNDWMQ